MIQKLRTYNFKAKSNSPNNSKARSNRTYNSKVKSNRTYNSKTKSNRTYDSKAKSNRTYNSKLNQIELSPILYWRFDFFSIDCCLFLQTLSSFFLRTSAADRD